VEKPLFQTEAKMNTIPLPIRHRARQSGMSLIEVVVAIVILSLGALGIAGLQARALKGNESSLQRTQAVISANYMIDALHADLVPRATTACDAGNVVFQAWVADVQNNLGQGTCGTITCVDNEPTAGITRCTVSVIWNDERAGGNANQNLDLSALFS